MPTRRKRKEEQGGIEVEGGEGEGAKRKDEKKKCRQELNLLNLS